MHSNVLYALQMRGKISPEGRTGSHLDMAAVAHVSKEQSAM